MPANVTIFIVQGNHMHLLVETDDGLVLSRGIKGLAVRIGRAEEPPRGPVRNARLHLAARV
jgi:hypothetical protein